MKRFNRITKGRRKYVGPKAMHKQWMTLLVKQARKELAPYLRDQSDLFLRVLR